MYIVFKEILVIYGKISVDFIVCRIMFKKNVLFNKFVSFYVKY